MDSQDAVIAQAKGAKLFVPSATSQQSLSISASQYLSGMEPRTNTNMQA